MLSSFFVCVTILSTVIANPLPGERYDEDQTSTPAETDTQTGSIFAVWSDTLPGNGLDLGFTLSSGDERAVPSTKTSMDDAFAPLYSEPESSIAGKPMDSKVSLASFYLCPLSFNPRCCIGHNDCVGCMLLANRKKEEDRRLIGKRSYLLLVCSGMR